MIFFEKNQLLLYETFYPRTALSLATVLKRSNVQRFLAEAGRVTRTEWGTGWLVSIIQGAHGTSDEISWVFVYFWFVFFLTYFYFCWECFCILWRLLLVGKRSFSFFIGWNLLGLWSVWCIYSCWRWRDEWNRMVVMMSKIRRMMSEYHLLYLRCITPYCSAAVELRWRITLSGCTWQKDCLIKARISGVYGSWTATSSRKSQTASFYHWHFWSRFWKRAWHSSAQSLPVSSSGTDCLANSFIIFQLCIVARSRFVLFLRNASYVQCRGG